MAAKGRGDQTAVRQLFDWSLEAGLAGQTVRLRCDQEPAIMGLCQDFAGVRAPAVTLLETSPVSSSSSVAGVNRYCQSLAADVRALKAQAEQTTGRTLSASSPIFAWLPRHAAWLRNRCQPYLGKATPFVQVNHRSYESEILTFGATVMVHLPRATELPKLEQRWSQGLAREDVVV